MNKYQRICVLGGTGFVGHSIVRKLGTAGYKVRVLSRHRERHRELLILPHVEVISTNIHNLDSLNRHFKDVDAVVNLVGILNEFRHKERRFQTVHIELARNIIKACGQNHIKRLLHMSALNADASKGSSRYLRSKGEAENITHTQSGIGVTSFRPSVIFGAGDQFFNRFAHLLTLGPKFFPFPLACPNAKFSPIYVEDIATCFVQSLENKGTYGKRYDLCGPNAYTLRELVQYCADLCGVNRKIWPLGDGLSSLQAALLGMWPGKPFTTENYRSMKKDSVCAEAFPEIFSLQRHTVEAIVPNYLGQNSIKKRFFIYRRDAKRDAV